MKYSGSYKKILTVIFSVLFVSIVVVQFLNGTKEKQSGITAVQTITVRDQWPESVVAMPSSLDREVSQWTPYLEWTLDNPSFAGNPYDLDASVEFIHLETGSRHITGMFFAGDNAWKFRFTGTLPGEWVFMSSSPDSDLDGRYGTVRVMENPGVSGFISHRGNKWMKQGTEEVFVPQYVMYAGPHVYYNNPNKIDEDIQVFLDEHGFNGFHTEVFCRWFDLWHERSDQIDHDDPNPDQRTFEALELLITKVHSAGGSIHIWAWGDEERSQTPIKWGINGKVDKRLQRYIAARLGPLPGWTMGYGFDLYEWVEKEQLEEWHSYLHSFLGWKHLLGARSHKNKLNQLSEQMDYSSYEQHRPDYKKYLETINMRPEKPSFSEDRFRVRKPGPHSRKDYTTDLVRRGLWHSAMAGGVANIWGYMPEGSHGSQPFPNQHQVSTYSQFIQNYFIGNYDVLPESDGIKAVKDPDLGRYIFYKEDTDILDIEKYFVSRDFSIKAIDTKKKYHVFNSENWVDDRLKVMTPYNSDWALIVDLNSNRGLF